MSSPDTAAPTRPSLGPRSIERPPDAGWTLVAGIDGRAPARVDRGGLVAPRGADWSVDWWIGADDRWYLPAREPAVRQHRSGPGPVLVTSMRVPSGDVVATAYPALTGSRPVTVVEIENASPVPVALAIALRPAGLDGEPARPHRLELIDGTRVAVDGEPALVLPRTPNERVAAGETDVVDLVAAGEPLTWDGAVVGSIANAACLYPLPHRTSLRFVVLGPGADRAERAAIDEPPGDSVDVDALPAADAVARGWATVVDRAARFRFPDPGLGDLVGAARARLIVAAPALPNGIEALDARAARQLEALAVGGHGDEIRPALVRLADRFPTRLPQPEAVAPGDRAISPAAAAASTLRAVARAADLVELELAEALLGSAAQLVSLVERRGEEAPAALATASLARLAERAGQRDAAHHLHARRPHPRRRPSSGEATGTAGDAADAGAVSPDRVIELAQRAAPAGSWPPGDRAGDAAEFLIDACRLLIDVAPGAPPGAPLVELLPTIPSAWLGGEVEVHRAPVAGLRVSFAIRWHGYRPALLWQVEPAGDAPADDAGAEAGPPPSFTLRCPGLDPDWSTAEPAGETLLAGTADQLPPAPGPGDSFA